MDATSGPPGTATDVRCERRARGAAGASLHLRLRSADGQNRLTLPTVQALGEALCQGTEDPSVALVILEADGAAFCAGGDAHSQPGVDGFRGFLQAMTALYRGLLACPAPVLARVQGHAVGGGASLALSCDLVVAAAGAKFAFPEARLGLAGPGFLLQRAGAFQRFAALCLAGRACTAQELQAAGMVNTVTTPEGFESESDAFIDAVLRQGAAGLRASKASLAAAAGPMLDALAQHVEIQAAAFERQRAERAA